MPSLPLVRQEAFARAMADGKSQMEACKIAGYSYTPSNAFRLAHLPHIEARVRELIQMRADQEVVSSRIAAKKLALTKEWVIERLMFNAERALRGKPVLDKDGNHTGAFSGKIDGTVANRALELLGQHLGMFIQRHEIGQPGDFARMTDAELDARVRAEAKALGMSEDMVHQMLLQAAKPVAGLAPN